MARRAAPLDCQMLACSIHPLILTTQHPSYPHLCHPFFCIECGGNNTTPQLPPLVPSLFLYRVWWRGRRGPRPPQPLPLRRHARRATPPACCHPPPPTHRPRITLVHSQQRLPAQPLLYLPFSRTLFCDSPVQPPLLRANPPVVYLGQFSSAVRSCPPLPAAIGPTPCGPRCFFLLAPAALPLRCPS
jgi:hypothetical protein